jgi:transcriptional regulator with XRE-family HTH domain
MLTTIMKSLGNKLKELREAKGLSLRRLAGELKKVTATHLSDIEKGTRYPSKSLLIKLASLHNINIEELESYDSRKILKEINQQAASDPSIALQIQGFIHKQSEPIAEQFPETFVQNDLVTQKRNESFEIEMILRSIATGIVKSFQLWEKTGISNALDSKDLQKGLDRLIAFCFVRKLKHPAHIPALLDLCERPFKDWGLPDLPEEVHSSDRLLVNKQPSFFCIDFARNEHDFEAALSEERYMQKVFLECAAFSPAVYSSLRELLIRKPVVTEGELIQKYLTPPLNAVPDLVKEAYEVAPSFLSHGGIFKCCPECGNLLLYTLNKEWICRDESCEISRVRTSHKTVDIPIVNNDKLYQLKYPIRRYVTAPGRIEIALYESLKRLGEIFYHPKLHYQIELWPNFDAYDLRLTFPGGEVWAIDVKDWSSPYSLAQRVKPFRSSPVWDKAFFVFPERYKNVRRNYLEAFRNRCVYLNDRVEAFYETDFLMLAESHLKDLYEKYK